MIPAFLISAAAIAILAYKEPYLLVRPSFIIAVCVLIRFNYTAALQPELIEIGLRHIYEFRWLCILLPATLLAWISLTPKLSLLATKLVVRCKPTADTPPVMRLESRVLQWLSLISSALLLLYLVTVPLRSTGLWAIFYDHENSTLAREESLKLLTFAPTRYGYAMYINVFGPLLASLIWLKREHIHKQSRWLLLPVLFAILISVSLSGARSMAAVFFLTLGVAHFLRQGRTRDMLVAIGALCTAAFVVTFLSVARQHGIHGLTLLRIQDTFSRTIARRILVDPIWVGAYYNRYAQDFGEVGVAAIRPLAILFGERYEPLPLFVSQAYRLSSVDTSFANAGFLFDFQAAFGMYLGFGVAVISVASLDYLLHCFRGIHGRTLTALLATFVCCVPALVSVAFSTGIMTNGIVPIAILALIARKYFSVSSKNLRSA